MSNKMGNTDVTRKDDGTERKVPTTERVLNYILQELGAGRLGPGDRVNAAKVSSTLGISAAPVREALAILAGRGVVILYPDRGAIVRPLDAKDVCELWEILGGVVLIGVIDAARAVARGEKTEEIVSAYEAIGRDLESVMPVDFYLRLNEYHYALNALAGKQLVTDAMNQLGVAYWDHYLASYIDVRAELPTYLNTYRRLHEAVMAGDEKGAAAVMQFHCTWSIGKVQAGAAALPSPRRRRSRKAAAGPA